MVEISGVRLRVDRHLSPTVRAYIYEGEYEVEEQAIIAATLQPRDVVMELGTGLGYLSAFCAKRIGSDRVFTYEANPALEPYIRQNFSLNDVSPSLSISLLGRGPSQQTFYVKRDFWGSSIVPSKDSAHALRVPVKSLNDELRRIDPTFLVIDIEGGEFELAKIIDFHQVEKVCMEVHEQYIGRDQVEFVLKTFMKAGFIRDPNLSTEGVWFLQRAGRFRDS